MFGSPSVNWSRGRLQEICGGRLGGILRREEIEVRNEGRPESDLALAVHGLTRGALECDSI